MFSYNTVSKKEATSFGSPTTTSSLHICLFSSDNLKRFFLSLTQNLR